MPYSTSSISLSPSTSYGALSYAREFIKGKARKNERPHSIPMGFHLQLQKYHGLNSFSNEAVHTLF